MKKYLLDVTLLIIFLLVMSFHYLPRVLHEVFGLAMFAAVIWHIILNRRRLFNFSRGKLTGKKIFQTLINFSTLITLLIIFVSGVCMSNFIFDDIVPLELRRNFTLHQLHVSLPYIFAILIGAHLGLNWTEIFNRLMNFFGVRKDSQLYTIFSTVLIALTIFFGSVGMYLNRVGDRILMKHIFATPATELPMPAFVLLFLAMIGFFTWAVHKLFKK